MRAPTLGEFVQQFGGAYFSTEGALWRTLGLLLVRPGELTRRYLAGRRKHYVLPLRLYLTISLATLFALQFVTQELKLDRESQVATFTDRNLALQLTPELRTGLKDGEFFCQGFPPWACRRFQARLDLDANGLKREFEVWPQRFVGRLGTAMFLLLPLFALLHKLVYLGRGLRYTEHLVYALHLHSFWFLAIALALLPLPGAGWIYAVMPLYALLAARRVFGGGWWGTIFRASAVATVYGVLLAAVLAIVAVWAFFFG